MAEKEIGKMSTDEFERREAGKKGKLWRLTIYYYHNDDPMYEPEEVRHKTIENLYGKEAADMRREWFESGFLLWIDPGHFRVYIPRHIKEVHIYKQKGYHEENFKK